MVDFLGSVDPCDRLHRLTPLDIVVERNLREETCIDLSNLTFGSLQGVLEGHDFVLNRHSVRSLIKFVLFELDDDLGGLVTLDESLPVLEGPTQAFEVVVQAVELGIRHELALLHHLVVVVTDRAEELSDRNLAWLLSGASLLSVTTFTFEEFEVDIALNVNGRVRLLNHLVISGACPIFVVLEVTPERLLLLPHLHHDLKRVVEVNRA